FTAPADGSVVHHGGEIEALDRTIDSSMPPVPGGAQPPAARGIAACADEPGKSHYFVVGANGHLYQATFANAWTGWVDLGQPPCGIASRPAAASWARGRIDVFVRGGDNAVWQIFYDGRWSGWGSLGGVVTSAPAVAS